MSPSIHLTKDVNDMQTNKLKIRIFLVQYIKKPDLEDDTDIFAGGFVSSLFAMQLITFLEKKFSIVIENEDLTLDNFKTINALDNLVERKLQIPGANNGNQTEHPE